MSFFSTKKSFAGNAMALKHYISISSLVSSSSPFSGSQGLDLDFSLLKCIKRGRISRSVCYSDGLRTLVQVLVDGRRHTRIGFSVKWAVRL
jgi:hypothetical protein